jgi:hypothetical protein
VITYGGVVVSRTHRPRFIPQEDSWFIFLLEAEWALGHSLAERLGKLKKKFNDFSGFEPLTFNLEA